MTKSKKSLQKPSPDGDTTIRASDDVVKKSPVDHRKRRIVILSIFGMFVFAAIVLATILAQHSYIPTAVAGIRVDDNTTKQSLEAEIEQRAAGYKMSIVFPDGKTNTATLAKMGLKANASATAEVALNTHRPKNLFRRLIWWRQKDVQVILKTNNRKFTTFINSKATKLVKPTQDAGLDIKSGKLVVTQEKNGEGYVVPGGKDAVLRAAAELKTNPLVTELQTIEPTIKAGDIAEAKQKAASYLKRRVVFNIENQPIKATAADIGKWIELTPVLRKKTIDVTINSGKILAYLDKVAAPYVQPPTSQVVMKNSGGGTVVLVPGKSGIDIVKKEAVATKVASELKKGNGANVDAIIDYAPYSTVEAQPYAKWLVVDTTNKRMYAYEKTKLVRTFLISAGAPATPTPIGTFKIFSKVRVQDMRGNNVDGSRYFQPNVEWVNYFASGGYAIHGNYWRPLSYFGNVNSSHGCVGIVNSDAAWVYNWASIGTTVVVHS